VSCVPGLSDDSHKSAAGPAGEGDVQGTAAVAERCRALVAGADECGARFARALDLPGVAWSFARARTEMCHGARLRRRDESTRGYNYPSPW